MVLRLDTTNGDPGRDVRLVQIVTEIDTSGLPVFDGIAGIESLDAPVHLFDGAKAELGHDLA